MLVKQHVISADAGQLSILMVGFVVVCLGLIAVVVDITAVHLARSQLLDLADAAALDAADSVQAGAVTTKGLETSLPLTARDVTEQASRFVADAPAPTRLREITVLPATGTTDGRSATVVLQADVRLPLGRWVVAAVTRDDVRVTVQSTARGDLDRG
ncbi:MAG: pilus assembly protein TadG-related protein [Actinomycetota bacterium]